MTERAAPSRDLPADAGVDAARRDRLTEAGVEWDCPQIPGQQFAEDQLVADHRRLRRHHRRRRPAHRRRAARGLPRLRIVAKWGDRRRRHRPCRGGRTRHRSDQHARHVRRRSRRRRLRVRAQLCSAACTRSTAPSAPATGQGRRATRRATTRSASWVSAASGARVAVRGQAVGMRVIGSEPSSPPTPSAPRRWECEVTSVDAVFAEADIVSLHCPLTPERATWSTRRLLARMRPGAYLVNVARGPVVDEAALVAALDERSPRGRRARRVRGRAAAGRQPAARLRQRDPRRPQRLEHGRSGRADEPASRRQRAAEPGSGVTDRRRHRRPRRHRRAPWSKCSTPRGGAPSASTARRADDDASARYVQSDIADADDLAALGDALARSRASTRSSTTPR